MKEVKFSDWNLEFKDSDGFEFYIGIVFRPKIDKEYRMFGYDYIEYDCQRHSRVCFWYFEIQYSLPWTAWR